MKNTWIAAAACAALSSVVLLAVSAPATPEAKAGTDNPGVAMPLLRLDFSAHGLVLSGIVPSTGERDAMVARARRLYGTVRVVDRLEVGSVANPSWLHAAYLPDLRGAITATALLADATLVIDGRVDAADSAADSAALISASTLPAREAGLTVLNRLRIGR